MMDLPGDEHFMREALRQAQKAYVADEVPVGAVVVRARKIIARAYNQVELLKDATAHAEMLALTEAEAAVGDWRLTDCDLYRTRQRGDAGPAVRDVRWRSCSCANSPGHFRLHRPEGRCGRKRDQSSATALSKPSMRYHFRRSAK